MRVILNCIMKKYLYTLGLLFSSLSLITVSAQVTPVGMITTGGCTIVNGVSVCRSNIPAITQNKTVTDDDSISMEENSSYYCPNIYSSLYKGLNDRKTKGQVSELQKFLADYFNVKISGGVFGQATKNYVVRFQKENGLPSVGTVGKMTREKIADICVSQDGEVESEYPENENVPTTSSSTLQFPTNSLKIYFNGNTQSLYNSSNMTREKAVSECNRVVGGNTSATSAKCVWGEEVIYQIDNVAAVNSSSFSVGGSPTLKIYYDQNQKESMLMATFNVAVKASGQDVNLAVNGQGVNTFYINLHNSVTGQDSGVSRNYTGNQGVSIARADSVSVVSGDSYIVKSGETAKFVVSKKYRPSDLLSGSYNAKIYLVQSPINLPSTNGVITNSVTLIGEKAVVLPQTTQEAVGFGMYEGFGQISSGSYHPEQTAYLEIPKSAHGKILVLTGYEPINWILRNPSNVNISNVIAVGFYDQRITMSDGSKLPFSVEYDSNSSNGVAKFAYQAGDTYFKDLATWLATKSINLSSSNFTGSYSAKDNDIFAKPTSQINTNVSIKLISPVNGANYRVGDYIPINWSISNAPVDSQVSYSLTVVGSTTGANGSIGQTGRIPTGSSDGSASVWSGSSWPDGVLVGTYDIFVTVNQCKFSDCNYYGTAGPAISAPATTRITILGTTTNSVVSVKWGPQSNTPFNAGTSASKYSFGGSCYSWTTVECGGSNVQTTGGRCVYGSRYSTDFGAVSCQSAIAPTIVFARTSGFVSSNISPNSTNVKIGSFSIQNTSNETITLSTSTVDLSFSGSFTNTNVSNLSLRAGVSNFGSPIGYVANNINYFSSSVPVTVSPYTTKTFDIYADIGGATSGSVTAGMTVYYYGNTSNISGSVTATGVPVTRLTPVVATTTSDQPAGGTSQDGQGTGGTSVILNNNTSTVTTVVNTGAIGIKDTNELGVYVFTPKSGEGDMSVSNLKATEALIQCRQQIISLDRCMWKDNEFYSAKSSNFPTASYTVYAFGTLKQTVVNTSKPLAEYMCYVDTNLNFKGQDVTCKWGNQTISSSAATILYLSLINQLESNIIKVAQNLPKFELGMQSGNGRVLGVSVSNLGCANIPYNLHRGAESKNVTKLQKFLQEKGLLSDVTGFYGDKTVEAVKDYQASKNLPVTGMVYDFTRQVIKEDSCN